MSEQKADLTPMEEECLRLLYHATASSGTHLLRRLREAFPEASFEDMTRCCGRLADLGFVQIGWR